MRAFPVESKGKQWNFPQHKLSSKVSLILKDCIMCFYTFKYSSLSVVITVRSCSSPFRQLMVMFPNLIVAGLIFLIFLRIIL